MKNASYYVVLVLALHVGLSSAGAQESEFIKDDDTLFLNHFNKNTDAEFSSGSSSIVTNGEANLVSDGKFGTGIMIGDGDWLRIQTDDGNLDLRQGTIEFWLKANFSGFEGRTEQILTLVSTQPTLSNFSIFLTEDSKIVCQMVLYGPDGELVNDKSLAHDIGDAEFFKNQWHHIALMWDVDDDGKSLKFWLRIDGATIGSPIVHEANGFEVAPQFLNLLSTHTGPASAGIVDELRISKTPRY